MRKLMWLTVGFVAATLLGCNWLDPQWFLLSAGAAALVLVVCLAIMIKKPKSRVAGMLVLGCILGFLWQLGFDSLYLSTVRDLDELEGRLTIVASDYSYETEYGCAVEGKLYSNGRSYKIRTYLPAETVLNPGDSVTGMFKIGCTLADCSRESDYYMADGTFLVALPRGEMTVTQAQKLPLNCYAAWLRHQITGRIQALFPADTFAFAQALLLGDTTQIDYATDTAFKLSGIRHVIAVSGMHVTILFSFIYAFVGRRRWLTALLGIPVLVFFAAVAGFAPSITRACIMHVLMVLAMLFGKDYDPPTALSFSVLVILCVNPWTITNVGFQLSVSCMVGIFLFSNRIQDWLLDRKRLGRIQGFLRKIVGWSVVTFAISVSASIFTIPLSAYHFGTVSLIAVLTNLLTLWIISFIFYGIILACLASCIFFPIGSGIAWVIAWPIRYVLWISKALAAFPLAAVYTESVYIVFWLILTYVLLAVYLLLRQRHPSILCLCATIGLCIALILSWLEPLKDDLRMTVLDVGQGQCILLQSEGKNYLVDCGGDSDTAAADKAAGLLLSQGIYKLDGLILTHYDRDHAGGAVHLLQRMKADVLYLPNSCDEDGVAQTLLSQTSGTAIRVLQDMQITFGAATITLIPSENADSDNESGLCVLFQREDCDILITGDRSAHGERELIRHMTLPDLEVLIVGHHGSKYSTCRELLIKTQPDIAIISVGEDNQFGHPTQEVLLRLEKYGCVIYRTDRDGTVVYRG